MAPGKPLTFVEQARRAQIVGVTIDVVAEHGFAKASLQRIADAAGLTKAAVLYHFPSKDAIVRAAYGSVLHSLTDDVGRAVDAASGAAALDAYVHSLVAHLRAHPAHVRMIVEAVVERTGADDVPSGPSRRDAVASLVEQAVAAGDYREGIDPIVVAVLVNGAVDAIVGQLLDDPAFDTAGAATELTELLRRGYGRNTGA
ncbi:TetR/AcrR family transcriptional regulator [Cryptosporangium arvum]|uniref:Transcriptional regulator n=1 Tax=Cryptosporangium arvum DSM 44712 TaxID=927661 RepID=A0A010ZSZ3_9ACTN|nr:TetR/AcrR family transcriptional regulator [Cryptosporangium arvum]EXG80327.1 transcriptional regulator [Cryptosporangium arvum DSM 44712]